MAKNYFFPLKKSKILRKISRSGRSSSHLNLRNILSVRPHPPYEKNKLLLNEYLGDFMHFETIFFVENDFFKPTHPTEVWKIPHFFLKPSLTYSFKLYIWIVFLTTSCANFIYDIFIFLWILYSRNINRVQEYCV